MGQRPRGIVSSLGRSLVHLVPKLSIFLGGVSLSLLFTLILAEIVARVFFKYGLIFAIEYSEYLLPAVALGGAAYTLSVDGHVRADIILRLLPNRVQQWLVIGGYLLGLVFLVMLAKQCLWVALRAIRMHYVSLYPTETPFGYFQLLVPIFLFLFATQVVLEIVRKTKAALSGCEHKEQVHATSSTSIRSEGEQPR
jgi:TRAP-type C4-dicarboxylate transport system permease small subunit